MDQEVDVQLFITCRLCLDEPGSYQIVPFIKKQINDCFNIEVDPFDRLPQLICKKCKLILNDYYVTKITFQDKQEKLRAKLLNQNNGKLSETENKNPDVASQCNPKTALSATDIVPHDSKVKLQRSTDAATCGNSAKSPGETNVLSQSNGAISPGSTGTAPQCNPIKKKDSWKKEYNEYFVCTICSKKYLKEKYVKKHMSTHNKILRRYENVFKKHLTITLNKIGSNKNVNKDCIKNVIYDKNKIICSKRNNYYCSYYLKKGFKADNEFDENENVAIDNITHKRESGGKRVRSDSSDEELCIKGKKNRSRRLFSTSSTKTIVLDDNEEKCESNTSNMANQNAPNVTEVVSSECVDNNNMTSDSQPKHKSELETSRNMPELQQAKATVEDYKSIQNIVNMSHKNYIKKIQSETNALNSKSSSSESSLKHKVLSLGRKVINKQGFSCTGILRYVEHKDLEITWKPSPNATQNKGTNFVRIMTKLKSRDDSENEDAGWKDLHDISICRNTGMERFSQGNVANKKVTISMDVEASPQPADAKEDSSLSIEANGLNNKNILPSKTPAAIPKLISKVKPVRNYSDMLPSPLVSGVEDAQTEGENMLLPIITSTTSLSTGEIENQMENRMPRIKVKPVSELMSEKALCTQKASETIWGFNVKQNKLPPHLPNTGVHPKLSVDVSQSDLAITNGSGISAPDISQNYTQSVTDEPKQTKEDGHVILNSPELPNTKTTSPFHYFKTILQMHGLKLLDSNDELHQHFNCLIKFKLMLKQDTKTPIGVLLSLFCYNNSFCFTFKDTNSKIFDPNLLPAFWQWELLKIYKSDVVEKILQNAIKMGKEVHDYTEHFLCLLKSIDLITES